MAAEQASTFITISAPAVNIRSGSGTIFDVIGRTGDWIRIEYDGRTAWVFSELTDQVIQAPEPTSPAVSPLAIADAHSRLQIAIAQATWSAESAT